MKIYLYEYYISFKVHAWILLFCYNNSMHTIPIHLVFGLTHCNKFYFCYSWNLFTLANGYHCDHYDDVTMGTIASQITSLTIVYSTVYSDADQRKHQSSASLAFVWGIHRGPVNSPHKWPVTQNLFPFDDVIMIISCSSACQKLNSWVLEQFQW